MKRAANRSDAGIGLPWRQRLAAIIAGVLLVVGTAGAAQLLAGGDGVRALVLSEAPRRVSAQALRDILARHDADLLAAIDLDALRAEIEALPWVRGAHVARRWPDRLLLRLQEHEVVARVGEEHVWTASGEILPLERLWSDAAAADEALAALPRLDAGAPYLSAAWEHFHRLREALADTRLVPQRLERDARGSWTLVTASGTALRLGKVDPAERVELLRDVVEPALGGRLERAEYVDLRYGNGFAVGWREPDPENEAW